jgi:integrase/recombinase XerD
LIESISHYPSLHLRHRSVPLLKERDQYLTHLLQMGVETTRVRSTATYLVHIVRILNLSSLRQVGLHEIKEASERWINYRSPERRSMGAGAPTTPKNFARIAKAWLSFHDSLVLPAAAGCFAPQLAEFQDALRSRRGLAPATVTSYMNRTRCFSAWIAEHETDLARISLLDVDRFLAEKRDGDWRLGTLATQCQGLRSFFGYAEGRGWCDLGIAGGIIRLRRPKYTDVPKGPRWAQVRQLIRAANGNTPTDLRARAMLLLYSVYALRSSEVARLRLEDFDWRNETFTVRRAKRGGIQQYPIQFEVGEAVLEYLQNGRPHCVCRNVFVTLHLPYRPIGAPGMWAIVKSRMDKTDIACEHAGPHSLRHACNLWFVQFLEEDLRTSFCGNLTYSTLDEIRELLRRFKVTVDQGEAFESGICRWSIGACFVILTPRQYLALKTRFPRKEPNPCTKS